MKVWFDTNGDAGPCLHGDNLLHLAKLILDDKENRTATMALKWTDPEAPTDHVQQASKGRPSRDQFMKGQQGTRRDHSEKVKICQR